MLLPSEDTCSPLQRDSKDKRDRYYTSFLDYNTRATIGICHNRLTYVHNVQASPSCQHSGGGGDHDYGHDEGKDAEADEHEATATAEVAAHGRDPPAVRTSRKSVVQRVELKRV
jgi:hypothetical protein